MKIISNCLNRPVTVVMIFILILITGIISMIRLPVAFLPEMGYPKLTVITSVQNSSPEEVEELVTKPVEQEVSTLKGVLKVESVSRKDLSIVSLKYGWGTEMSYASLDLREKLDNIRHILPGNAQRPGIVKLDPNDEPVMYIALTNLYTDRITEIQDIAESLVKRRLQQLEGVASADLIGKLEKEIQIWLDQDKLGILNLQPDNLKTQIAKANINIPAGSIRDGQYRFNLKIKGEFKDLGDILNTPVVYSKTADPVILGDIAEVRTGYKRVKSLTRMDSKPSIGILIRKEADHNTVEVCRRVRRNLESLQTEYPFIGFTIPVDQSRFIESSIHAVLEALILGGCLAFLVLFLFLKDIKSPVHIALSIPIAVLASFIMMHFTGITFNIISLSGLALGVGMLVDNSIVVSESIFRKKDLGRNWFQAALEGTSEVGLAIITSTLTTLAVFLPVLYIKGIAASIFKQQALTVTYSLLASLLVSITLLPLLASLRKDEATGNTMIREDSITSVVSWVRKGTGMFKRSAGKYISRSSLLNFLSEIQNKFETLLRHLIRIHTDILEYALGNRTTFVMGFTLLLASAVLIIINLDREFFPEFDQDSFTILIRTEPGTILDSTNEITIMIENFLQKDVRIRNYFTSVGRSTDDMMSYYLEDSSIENLAEIRVSLNCKSDLMQVMDDYRDRLKRFPAQITFRQSDNYLISMIDIDEPGLSVNVFGENPSLMKRKAADLYRQIADNGSFYNIRRDYDREMLGVEILLDHEAMARYDISAEMITSLVTTKVSGYKVSEFHRFDDNVEMNLYLDRNNDREGDIDLESLLNIRVNSRGNSIPLRALVKSESNLISQEIKRLDRTRVYTMSFGYKGGLRSAVNELEEICGNTGEGNRKYPVQITGINRDIIESLKSLTYALIFAVILIYMILAAQFESFRLPLIIILVTPMGLIGVAFSLLVTDTAISLMSTLGMIILAGIIVNDAILLIDYANRLRKHGLSPSVAVVKAAETRFRPIIMTTFTTVLGLLPLAVGIGSGSELQSAMAISVIGGILSATFLTLILTPVLYVMIGK